MPRFDQDTVFCGNPDCALHVVPGAPGVMGWGNWARMPDGRIVGRESYYGVMLCDDCRRAWRVVWAAARAVPPFR